MNILILTSIYPCDEYKKSVGATTKVVHYFAKEWVNQGHNVLVIHNSQKFPKLAYLLPQKIKSMIKAKTGCPIHDVSFSKSSVYKIDGVEVYRLPMLKYYPHANFSPAVINKQVNLIISTLDNQKFVPDLIIGHWANPQAPILSLLKRHINCKMALVIHAEQYINSKRFNLLKHIKKIDVIGCRSEALARAAYEKMNLPSKPFICYSGIPDKYVDVNNLNLEKYDNKDCWKFLYVGELIEKKYVDRILLALAKIKDYINFEFDIVGIGAEENKLEKLCKKVGLQKNVVFHGRVTRDQVVDLMKNAHCFTMISKPEAFGLVYLEAMASGCLVVGSRGEGIDGVIIDNENGFLCKAGDSQELAEIFSRIIRLDVEKVKYMAIQAFNTAEQMTDSKVSKQYLDYILKIR